MRTRCLVFLAACADPSPVAPPPNVATGSLDPWQQVPALPTARANHCTAAIGDYVLVIGGNFKQGESFVKTDEIHAAKLAGDGTFGSWQLAGRTPSPVTECSATSDGRTLYLLDGLFDDETDARGVFAAELDETGILAPFVAMTTLPQIAISSEASVHRADLVMMDTVLPADGDQTVTLRMPLAGGAWITDDWGIGFRAQAQYAFAGDFGYTIGGYKGDPGNPVSDEVFVATLGTASARPTTKLPVPFAFGEAIAVDDFVFVIGGRDQVFGAPATTVLAAPIHADGSLGAWISLAPLPIARTNHELALVGDFLVISGGAGGMGGDTNVLATRVRFPVVF